MPPTMMAQCLRQWSCARPLHSETVVDKPPTVKIHICPGSWRRQEHDGIVCFAMRRLCSHLISRQSLSAPLRSARTLLHLCRQSDPAEAWHVIYFQGALDGIYAMACQAWLCNSIAGVVSAADGQTAARKWPSIQAPCASRRGTIVASPRLSFPQHSPCLIADTPRRSSSEKLALFFATRLTHCGTDRDSQAPENGRRTLPSHHSTSPELGEGRIAQG